MNTQSIYALLDSHQYVLLTAVIIGFIVRLLKSDTKIPIDVPPRLRIWLAFALGAGAGVLEKVAGGTPWKPALFDGAVAAVAAVLGQNVVVDSLRGGKELPVPGLTVKGASPSPGKPITIPPGPPSEPPGVTLALFFVLFAPTFLVGCAKFFKALDLAADKAACVVQYQDLPNEQIMVKCFIEPADFDRYVDLLSESRRSTAKALSRQAAENPSTRVDAGAPDGGGK